MFTNIQNKQVLKAFAEYQVVQHGVIQHVLKAINDKCLTYLRYRDTRQIPTNIRQLVMSLFYICDKIIAHKLRQKYDVVIAMDYAIIAPIDIIFY